jgi:ATP-dependent DNA helicase RecG
VDNTYERNISNIKGIGKVVEKKLNKLGIYTIYDLVHFYPRKYNDFSKVTKISELSSGAVTVRGRIVRIANKRTYRRNYSVTEAVIEDGGGSVRAVWFNQPYLAASLPKETEVFVSGNLEFKYNSFALQNPIIERVRSFTVNTARIVPVYRETNGLSSKQIRNFIKLVLPEINKLEETLPKPILQSQSLQSRAEALRQIHFPDSSDKLGDAKYRIAFEELFFLIMTSLVIKNEIKTEHAPRIRFDKQLAKSFVKELDFPLTNAQRKSAWQIIQDIDRDIAMNRLLEGDVGSGKTVVSAMAGYFVVHNGYQVVLMAPTSILAEQHYHTFNKILHKHAKVSLIIGGSKSKETDSQLDKVAKGETQIIIGTHALLEKKVRFHKLGLVIIDEQHRFGVDQRKLLKTKSEQMPHLLTMSATPIPRSLALTIYGDLDISVIDEMPPGRKTVVTKVIKEPERQKMYFEIEKEINSGNQVFVVCPLIVDSDVLGVKSVEQEADRLRKEEFGDRKIAVLHGRMKNTEKQAIIDDFRLKKIDILVATTIVEIGVDIPSASVMLIEGAERFGLATLHQLRGRIGRSEIQSYCYVMAPQNSFSARRLLLLEKYSDGFTLAQKDLEMRGAGAIYGKAQHGILDLKMANISDVNIISKVRKVATEFMSQEILSDYPELLVRINNLKRIKTLD